MKLLITLIAVALFATGCAPSIMRGGAGTGNPGVDQAALSVGLDREDINYLVHENIESLSSSNFWQRTVRADREQPTVAIWPIENHTTRHMEDQLLTILSSIETSLVNSGDVRVIARSRQEALTDEIGWEQGAAFNPASVQQLGHQLGAKYFVTGRVTSVDEKLKSTRRLQYSLFMQVINVETGQLVWQNEVTRSKKVKR
jgi:uncharacterized protein (TIGR02722 family)